MYYECGPPTVYAGVTFQRGTAYTKTAYTETLIFKIPIHKTRTRKIQLSYNRGSRLIEKELDINFNLNVASQTFFG